MKNFLIPITAVVLLAACQSAPDADTVQTAAAEATAEADGTPYAIDNAATTIKWVGVKQTGAHEGTFGIKNGKLVLSGTDITGGEFEIDVNALQVTDITGEDKANLEGHLKSGDFFDAANYPTAKFSITAVAPYDAAVMPTKLEGATHLISGNLTLKESTVNITFPAKVTIADGAVMAEADFNIDRTQWGLNYKGPNNPADWFIKKEVELQLNIKAQGQQL